MTNHGLIFNDIKKVLSEATKTFLLGNDTLASISST